MATSAAPGRDNGPTEEVCNPAAVQSPNFHGSRSSSSSSSSSTTAVGVKTRQGGGGPRAATVLTCSHVVALLCGVFLATVAPLRESSRGTAATTRSGLGNLEDQPHSNNGAGRTAAPPAALHNGPMTQNIPLSQRHRVCVTQWTLIGAAAANYSQRFVEPVSAARPLGGRNPLTDDLDSLFSWARAHGYEGLEMTADDFRVRWFPRETYARIVAEVRQRTVRYNLPVVGSLLHVTDGDGRPGTGAARRMHADGLRYDLDFADPDFWDEMARRLQLQRQLGAEYVTYQISLPSRHQNTGGEYRHDDRYLRRVAQDISRLQGLAFESGLNFYVETHVARVSEDPEAFVKIMDYAPTYFEVNVDISHYVYRNIVRGSFYDRIMQRAGHTHQRMARAFGDLSSDVLQHLHPYTNATSAIDPKADWQQGGLTFQAWAQMQPALRNGLSSRCIVGESGPWQLVYDAMATDATLVPLYRLMAARADEWLAAGRNTTAIDVTTKPLNPFP